MPTAFIGGADHCPLFTGTTRLAALAACSLGLAGALRMHGLTIVLIPVTCGGHRRRRAPALRGLDKRMPPRLRRLRAEDHICPVHRAPPPPRRLARCAQEVTSRIWAAAPVTRPERVAINTGDHSSPTCARSLRAVVGRVPARCPRRTTMTITALIAPQPSLGVYAVHDIDGIHPRWPVDAPASSRDGNKASRWAKRAIMHWVHSGLGALCSAPRRQREPPRPARGQLRSRAAVRRGPYRKPCLVNSRNIRYFRD